MWMYGIRIRDASFWSRLTDDWAFTCAHCGRTFTRAELIEANAESIDMTVSDMGDDIVDALAKDLKKALKKQGWKIK